MSLSFCHSRLAGLLFNVLPEREIKVVWADLSSALFITSKSKSFQSCSSALEESRFAYRVLSFQLELANRRLAEEGQKRCKLGIDQTILLSLFL